MVQSKMVCHILFRARSSLCAEQDGAEQDGVLHYAHSDGVPHFLHSEIVCFCSARCCATLHAERDGVLHYVQSERHGLPD